MPDDDNKPTFADALSALLAEHKDGDIGEIIAELEGAVEMLKEDQAKAGSDPE